MVCGAELKHFAEEGTESCDAADYEADAVFGIAPDHNVADAVEVIIRVVEVDGILQSNACRQASQDSETQEEPNTNLRIRIKLQIPQQRDRCQRAEPVGNNVDSSVGVIYVREILGW